VEYFNSGELSFLLKKASGNHEPWFNCCNTPPICVSDASTARETIAPGVGCTNLVHAANAALPAVKTDWVDPDQTNVFGLPRNKSVNSLSVPAIPGKNLL
jgi:hypothetical protein